MDKSMFGEIKITECKTVSFKDGTTYTVRNNEIYKYEAKCTEFGFGFSLVDNEEKVRDLLPDEILLGGCLIKHKGEEKLLKFD